MDKLEIELSNCFGIDSLRHIFEFEKGRVFSIYARNGLMKTSFAKTFQLIQKGKIEDVSDAIFGNQGSAIVKIDGQDISKNKYLLLNRMKTHMKQTYLHYLLKVMFRLN